MVAGRFNGVGQTAAKTFFQHQPIHHQFNGVFFILLAADLFCQVIQDSIHSHPGKACFPSILKDFFMLALFPSDNRRKHQKFGSLPQIFHPVHNLVNGLPANLLAAFGTVGYAHPCPQKTQVVVDLRHRSHRGTWILGGGLLIDGNGR